MLSATLEPLSRRDESRLNRALGLSYESKCKMRHGALIYKSNSLISTGINSSRVQNRYVSFMEDKPPAYHAEEKAIMNARAIIGKSDLSGMVLYVARSYKNGKAAMSAPCQSCQTLIKEAGIKKVIFTVGES